MIYLQIFWVFFRISFLAFGGVIAVLPELERSVVDPGWVTHAQFFQAFILGQIVPGPNMAMAPLVGYQIRGMGGWAAAFLGIYSAPILTMALSFSLYRRYRHLGWVRRTEIGLRPLVFGLLLGAGGLILREEASGHWGLAILLGGGGAALLASRRLGPIVTMFGVGVAWWLVRAAGLG